MHLIIEWQIVGQGVWDDAATTIFRGCHEILRNKELEAKSIN
jgi:hypothetical protein